MQNIRALIETILNNGYLMSIASVDDTGPWVSDVIYIADDAFNLYFISRLEFRHSKAFLKNPKSAGTITVTEKPEGQSTGVQIEGIVKMVQNIPTRTLDVYSQKRGSKTMWKLAEGEAWYRFTPSKFDLIYEPLFGFTKKSLVLESV